MRRCLVTLALLTASLWLSAVPAQADFCESQVVHDYAKVLKRLPAIHSPPLDQHLNFAPARVFLGRHSSGPLQLEPDERGFILSFSPWSEGNSASRLLDWNVISRLVKIDRRGRPLGRPQTIERHVKRVPENGVDFGFEVPGAPAIYRLEIVFENGWGKRLGRFGEYFRVLRPSLDVDFFLSGTSFHRGEIVQAYLVNRGVSYLYFGLERSIQYFDGTSWTSPPGSWGGSAVPAIGLGIGPGVRTSCWSTTIPSDAGLGTYKFIKTVDRSTSARFGRGTPLEVSAEFMVTE